MLNIREKLGLTTLIFWMMSFISTSVLSKLDFNIVFLTSFIIFFLLTVFGLVLSIISIWRN